MKIPILYEDEAFIAVSKPNNILVHPSYYARNIKTPSLIELLADQIPVKLFPLHRLDHKTSGVLLLAKSSNMAAEIQQQFESNTIEKVYFALLRGFTGEKGVIDSPVKNANNGKYKEALTNYQRIESVEVNIPVKPYAHSRYSLVKFMPKSGRMHQLRIHSNKISHPIIGDHKYGNRHHNRMFETELSLPNLFLHAFEITLKHPLTDKVICIQAPLPAFWSNMRNKLGFKWNGEI